MYPNIPWNIRFDTIGLFPTWQTLTAQVIIFAIAVFFINLTEGKEATAKVTNE